MHCLQNTVPAGTRTRIIAGLFNSLTIMLFNWLLYNIIVSYHSSIDNIIYNEPSGPNF